VDHPVHRESAHAETVEEVHDLDRLVRVAPHQRGVRQGVQTRGQSPANALHGLGESPRRADDAVMQFRAL
jgi:hypothetical protein